VTAAQDSSPAARVNVADRLATHAAQRPDAIAVASMKPAAEITFAQLDRDATRLARGLIEIGVQPGHRMALLVKPGVEFVTLVFALLRSGATLVLVDAGLGKRNIVRCLESTSPDGFVAIPQGQALRLLLGKRFPKARLNVTVGRRWGWGGETLESLRTLASTPPPCIGGLSGAGGSLLTTADDPAAIVFTSGSTGPPKGVLYRHETFVTQADEIQRQYDLQPGAVDLACFPLFGLFNVACGVTTVLPEMDFSRPASCDPRKLFKAANAWRCTQSFASPAVWDKLSRHAEACGERMPAMRKVFSCGAPVPAGVIRRTLAMVHPEAQLHTPYGATEALPVATIEAQEVLSDTAPQTDRGAGVCVGRRFESIEWRVIRITDEPIATIDKTEELPQGEIGELIVRGPQVSRTYLTDPSASAAGAHNARAKIHDGQTVWHRMGDVGYLDQQQRFWYCGRKSHRVVASEGTLFTIPVEAVFNTHDKVRRSALVGVNSGGHVAPVIAYETFSARDELFAALTKELRQLADQFDHTRPVQYFLRHPRLPTDIRHNSKINRERLAKWAAKKLQR
jgi:acyl-CoA synthetase (AMP-forming)/AMP-acid ligase II